MSRRDKFLAKARIMQNTYEDTVAEKIFTKSFRDEMLGEGLTTFSMIYSGHVSVHVSTWKENDEWLAEIEIDDYEANGKHHKSLYGTIEAKDRFEAIEEAVAVCNLKIKKWIGRKL